MSEGRLTRRASITKLGGAGLAAALGWKAVDEASGAGPAAVASGAVSCVLAPESTEGPFFLQGDKVRRNVTEGKPGVPLTLKLTVLDVSTCKPIRGAAVDIWHCDAVGTYAGGDEDRDVPARHPEDQPRRASRRSRRSTQAGIGAARCTSTSGCRSAATSSTPASCTSRTA